jgi:hypothetical protein
MLASLTTVACGSDADDGGSEGGGESNVTGAGADGFPVGADGKPVPSKLDGQYEITTELDLTKADAVPEKLADTLTALSNFKEKPSQTLVDLMDTAGVPAASFLNLLPGPVRPSVLGWIDEHILKAVYDAVPITKRITGLLDDIGSIATKFQLITTLDIPAVDAAFNAKGKHSVRGFGFDWDGKQHVIEVPAEIRSKIADQNVAVNAAPLAPRSKDLELGRLQVGEHMFGLPVGTFALKAIDQLATDRFGADLRGSLGKVLNCDKLAEAIGQKCIDPFGPGKVCVGHEADIKKLCTSALDVLVNTISVSVKGLDIGLKVKVGVAQMWDPPKPGDKLDAVADRLDLGFWTGGVVVNNTEKSILATWGGKRVGGGAAPPPPPAAPAGPK